MEAAISCENSSALEGQFFESDELNMESNNLDLIPNEILLLRHLRFLFLAHNHLRVIPNEVGNLRNLVFLDLSHNKLHTLPHSMCEIVNLRYLNLSDNMLSSVPYPLQVGLRHLRFLNLSNNRISNFSDSLLCASTISEINISYNQVKKIPKWLFFSCKVQCLDLSHNELIKLSNITFGNYAMFNTYITELKLTSCSLTQKSLKFLSSLRGLITLKMNNDIEEHHRLHNYFGNFDVKIFERNNNLKNLTLNHVGMSIVTDNFYCLQFIEYLDLEYNYLTWLPTSFCDLHSLRICKLSNNIISFLPDQFGKLINLKELYLSNNNLSEIPGSFYDLINLEYIDLYGNKLEYINLEIIDLHSLKGIDLEYNHLDFSALCSNHVDYKQFTSKYELLKQFYRQKLDISRCDEQIENEVESELVNSSFVCSSESEKHEFDGLQDSGSSPVNDIEKENWDTENMNAFTLSSEHDDFDPNANYSQPHEKKKKQRNNYTTDFCPGENHVPSLMMYFIKNISRNMTEESVDGQFDLD